MGARSVENFFQWRQEWVLDLKNIDDQHRMLVGAVNKLSPLYLRLTKNPKGENASREKLTARLNLLYGDLEQHFRDEEKLMLEVAYPHHRSHAHAHVMLLAELKNYCNRITNRDEELDMGTLYSLKTWFITHMLDDREFAAHYHASRIGDRHRAGRNRILGNRHPV
jgi:hemerythrin-like metal-binding protein